MFRNRISHANFSGIIAGIVEESVGYLSGTSHTLCSGPAAGLTAIILTAIWI
jgi:MFS superfamily sulfate permease-like transporter